MNPALPLDEMSAIEKLTAIEQLWQSLSGNPADVPAPQWHADILAARERRVRDKASGFVPLDEMKERIRKAKP